MMNGKWPMDQVKALILCLLIAWVRRLAPSISKYLMFGISRSLLEKRKSCASLTHIQLKMKHCIRPSMPFP